MKEKYNPYDDPVLMKKVSEKFIARYMALDEQPIVDPVNVYYDFIMAGQEPCYLSDGQFCGGIEAEWYEKGGRIYKFTFYNAEIIEAFSENDIEKEYS